jgi:hypothetical protein
MVRWWWFTLRRSGTETCKPEDAEAIVQEHLMGGRPVERLRVAENA